MNRPPRLHWLLVACLGLAVGASRASADRHVAVVSNASADYTQRKFGEGKPRPESYVFMQGNYYAGVTADRSIDKMTFRQIAGFLAPELAKAQYFPGKDPKAADLLLVVHWGTTVPSLSTLEMRAQVSAQSDLSQTAAGIEKQVKDWNETHTGVVPESSLYGGDAAGMAAAAVGSTTLQREAEFDGLEQLSDQILSEMARSSNVRLLGYGNEIRRLSKQLNPGEEEKTLRSDLAGERYFIIVRAYDLRAPVDPGQTRRAVWTLHANIRSPGNNFSGALGLMGDASVNFFGRTTDGVVTVRPDVREGKVNLAPLVIIGEVK